MEIEDIEAALEARDRTGLQDAFRALVADEDEVAPLDSADEAADLLMRVCDGLMDDPSYMPAGVVEVINLNSDGELTDSAYAAGAAAVKADIERWRGLFRARMGEVG